LRAGWSGEHSYHRPNEAVDWAGIGWAMEQGLRWYDFQGDDFHMQGFGEAAVTSPGPLERVVNPLLRRMYSLALHRVLDTRGTSRLKQVIRSRGWPGSSSWGT